MSIEIIPGVAIGTVRLGMPRRELPTGVTIQRDAGVLEGVHFLLDNDVVDEIWIEDLRTLGREVKYKGQRIDGQASLEQLQEIFGPCAAPEEVLGGTRIACASGVQLGIASDGPTTSIQVRLRR